MRGSQRKLRLFLLQQALLPQPPIEQIEPSGDRPAIAVPQPESVAYSCESV